MKQWYAKYRAQIAQHEAENRANPMLRVVRDIASHLLFVVLICVYLLVVLIVLTLYAPRPTTPPAPTPMVLYVDRPVLVPYPMPREGR